MLLKMNKYHESDTNLMLYSGKQEDGWSFRMQYLSHK